MKSTVWDYVLSGFWITVLLLLALGAVWAVTPPLRGLLGDYHVVAGALLFLVVFGLACAVAVRMLVRWRPIEPCADGHALDSSVFAHWKLVTVLYHLGRGALRIVTPFFLLPLVDALLGAKIGKDVAFGGMIDDPYLVSIGDGVVLGHNSLVSGSYLWDGRLVCGPVTIEGGATIGANAVVFPDVVVGAGANVMTGACVMPGSRIPPGEIWRGNPARRWVQAGRATGSPSLGEA